MGGLQRFERRLGGLVEGGFARVFRGRVEPVELAAALARETDTNKAVGPQRVLVPNVFEIELGRADHVRLAPYSFTLAQELAAMVREHAAEQGYSFVGPVTVALVEQPSLSTGSFRLLSRVEAGPGQAEGSASPPVRPPVAAPPPAMPSSWPPPVPSALPPPAPGPSVPEFAHTTVLPPMGLARHGHLVLPDGQEITVGDRPLVLGRGTDADVRISDASVSRRHARVSAEAGTVTVEDLGSTNGTTVNGISTRRQSLRDGDSIGLGGSVVVFRS